MKLDFIDVRRAYFYAEAARNIYIELPEEDYDKGKVGTTEEVHVRNARCGSELGK